MHFFGPFLAIWPPLGENPLMGPPQGGDPPLDQAWRRLKSDPRGGVGPLETPILAYFWPILAQNGPFLTPRGPPQGGDPPPRGTPPSGGGPPPAGRFFGPPGPFFIGIFQGEKWRTKGTPLVCHFLALFGPFLAFLAPFWPSTPPRGGSPPLQGPPRPPSAPPKGPPRGPPSRGTPPLSFL